VFRIPARVSAGHLLRWNEAARYELSEGETGRSNHSMTDTMQSRPATVAMVFAGGLGLGAYHAGAYQAGPPPEP
jgi:hypothetical protein